MYSFTGFFIVKDISDSDSRKWFCDFYNFKLTISFILHIVTSKEYNGPTIHLFPHHRPNPNIPR